MKTLTPGLEGLPSCWRVGDGTVASSEDERRLIYAAWRFQWKRPEEATRHLHFSCGSVASPSATKNGRRFFCRPLLCSNLKDAREGRNKCWQHFAPNRCIIGLNQRRTWGVGRAAFTRPHPAASVDLFPFVCVSFIPPIAQKKNHR